MFLSSKFNPVCYFVLWILSYAWCCGYTLSCFFASYYKSILVFVAEHQGESTLMAVLIMLCSLIFPVIPVSMCAVLEELPEELEERERPSYLWLANKSRLHEGLSKGTEKAIRCMMCRLHHMIHMYENSSTLRENR